MIRDCTYLHLTCHLPNYWQCYSSGVLKPLQVYPNLGPEEQYLPVRAVVPGRGAVPQGLPSLPLLSCPPCGVRMYFGRLEQFLWFVHINDTNRRGGKTTLSGISTVLPFYLVIFVFAEYEILPFRISSDLHPFCSGLNNSQRCKTVKNWATGMH